MQLDFHYYATYAAAYIAGYSHEESLKIAYCAQFVDCCSKTLLLKIGGPVSAATTQLQLELMEADTDLVGLQNITRIWASFHFLPGDLYAKKKKCSRAYLNKYRLICNTNSELLIDTVERARGKGPQAVGVAMHILADTWAHRYFAGTPSLVINNTNYDFYEIIPDGDSFTERLVKFNHNPATPDVPEKGIYTNSIYQGNENSIMNLGHGRAGHFPDYSYARYKYMPAWGGYSEIVKDNPSDFRFAFMQMIYAMQTLRTEGGRFEIYRYADEEIEPWSDEINEILQKRQIDACADWKAFAEKLSGCEVPDFDINQYQDEYMNADKDSKDDTFLGRFIIAALGQKSMVTNRIFTSGSLLAGFSVDFSKKGFKGMKDFQKLVNEYTKSQLPIENRDDFLR